MRPGEIPAITRPLVDVDQAQALAQRVTELDRYWTRRDPEKPFFTFGAASYLDPPEAYAKGWARTNPVLAAEFAELYEILKAALEEILEAPVSLRSDAALPGFHAHGWCRLFEWQAGRVHTDRQYQRVPWDEADQPDFTRPLSFTLPLRLPRGGAGLYTWPIHLDEIEDKPAAELRPLFRERPKELLGYRPGELVLHSGHQVHQIAPLPKGEKDAWRITLQGHGIHCRDGWKIYW